jgi:hypothetical protein
MLRTLSELKHRIHAEHFDEIITVGWNNSVLNPRQEYWLWCEDEITAGFQVYFEHNGKCYAFVGVVSAYYFEEQYK